MNSFYLIFFVFCTLVYGQICPSSDSNDINGLPVLLLPLNDTTTRYLCSPCENVKNGTDGKQGPQGPPGPQGPSGIVPMNTVLFGGNTWNEANAMIGTQNNIPIDMITSNQTRIRISQNIEMRTNVSWIARNGRSITFGVSVPTTNYSILWPDSLPTSSSQLLSVLSVNGRTIQTTWTRLNNGDTLQRWKQAITNQVSTSAVSVSNGNTLFSIAATATSGSFFRIELSASFITFFQGSLVSSSQASVTFELFVNGTRTKLGASASTFLSTGGNSNSISFDYTWDIIKAGTTTFSIVWYHSTYGGSLPTSYIVPGVDKSGNNVIPLTSAFFSVSENVF